MAKRKIALSAVLIVLIAIMGVCFYFQENQNAETKMAVEKIVNELSDYKELTTDESQELREILMDLDDMLNTRMAMDVVDQKVEDYELKTRIEHMQRTAYLSVVLMKNLEEEEGISFTKEEAEDLIYASYIHDMCKYEEGDHALNAAHDVEKNFKEALSLDKERIHHISKLVKYHNRELSEKKKENPTRSVYLIELIQDADAADKIINQRKNMDEHYEELHLESSKDYVDKHI